MLTLSLGGLDSESGVGIELELGLGLGKVPGIRVRAWN